jgi:hypothetical protein
MERLNLIHELMYKGAYYYIDIANDWYALNPNIALPCSPVVNYKKYNDVSYFNKVSDDDLNSSLTSELEQLLDECVGKLK